jgi:hypothetical protein
LKLSLSALAENLELWAKTRDDEADKAGIAYGADKFARTQWLHEAAAALAEQAQPLTQSRILNKCTREQNHEIAVDVAREFLWLIVHRWVKRWHISSGLLVHMVPICCRLASLKNWKSIFGITAILGPNGKLSTRLRKPSCQRFANGH